MLVVLGLELKKEPLQIKKKNNWPLLLDSSELLQEIVTQVNLISLIQTTYLPKTALRFFLTQNLRSIRPPLAQKLWLES